MYFYHWHGGRDLHVHSGKLVPISRMSVCGESYTEYNFETDDGSNKKYLHCGYDHTYSRNQVILEERDDLKAVEKLIENYEHLIKYYNNAVTRSMINSLNNLKILRDKLKEEQQMEAVGCEFCTTNTDEREMIIEFDLNLGLIGTAKVYTFIDGEKESYINTTATIETSSDTSEDLGWVKRKIKYCPVCGRKLGE